MRTFWKTEVLRTEYGNTYEARTQVPEDEAILIGSLSTNQTQCRHWWKRNAQHLMHEPCLDIDYAAKLIPSSTPGHFHLYLDKPVTWRQYKKVLKAMAEAGLIEWGYYQMSVKRRGTFLRKPGVIKGKEQIKGKPVSLPSSYSGAW